MSLILKEREICPHSRQCKYNRDGHCYGSKPGRETVFTCEFVVNGKIIDDGYVRNPKDVTGKMEVLVEGT